MITKSKLYDYLVKVAQAGRTTTYAEVTSHLGLNPDEKQDKEQVMHMLLDIACQENAEGRPMLSIVVVMPEIGYPGNSFFLLARELGANSCCDDRSFFSYELRRVHSYWRKPVREYQYQSIRAF